MIKKQYHTNTALCPIKDSKNTMINLPPYKRT